MSVQAITWALSVRAGSPSAKCVLLALANYANKYGQCWPSQERLAAETDQSVDSVQRRIKDLENRNLIARLDRGRRCGKSAVTIYSLRMPGCEAQDRNNTEPVACRRTNPQSAAPQVAASTGTRPQNEGIETAMLRHEPKEPLFADPALQRGCGRSKSLITPEAVELASDLMRLQRLDNADPRVIGAAYQVQEWLSKGWQADLIRQGVDIVMARRKEAPRTLRYFERAIAECHSERDRPLPPANATIIGDDHRESRTGKRTIHRAADDLLAKMRAITASVDLP